MADAYDESEAFLKEALPHSLTLFDKDGTIPPRTPIEIFRENRAISMIASNLYDYLKECMEDDYLCEKINVVAHDDGVSTFISFHVRAAENGAIDSEAQDKMIEFFNHLKALNEKLDSRIDVDPAYFNLYADYGAADFVDFLDKLAQIENFVVGPEPSAASKESIGYFRLDEIEAAIEASRPNSDLNLTTTFTKTMADEGAQMSLATVKFREILIEALGDGVIYTALYEAKNGYRLVLMPNVQDDPESQGKASWLLDNLLEIATEGGIQISAEDNLIRLQTSEQFFAICRKTEEILGIDPAAPEPEEKPKDNVFWGIPMAKTSIEHCLSVLYGLSRYLAKCSPNVEWEYKIKDEIAILTPRVNESEDAEHDWDRVELLLKSLIEHGGDWEGLGIFPKPASIEIHDFIDFSNMLETYAAARGFTYGNDFLETIEVPNQNDTTQKFTQEALDEDPTLLACLRAKAYSSQKELLLDVARLLYVAEKGKYAGPSTPADIRAALGREISARPKPQFIDMPAAPSRH